MDPNCVYLVSGRASRNCAGSMTRKLQSGMGRMSGPCIATFVVLSLAAFCSGYNNATSHADGGNITVNDSDSVSPLMVDNESVPTVVKGDLQDNDDSIDHLHVTAIGNSNYASDPREPCEADRFPCDQDQWCSPSRKVCRPCSDLDDWCNQTALIHQDYPACEGYCYGLQTEKMHTCENEKENLTQVIRETDSALADAKLQANQMEKNCSNNIEKAKEDQAEQLSDVQEELAQCRRAGSDRSPAASDPALAVVLPFVAVWALPAAALAFYFWRKERKTRASQTDGHTAETAGRQNVVEDHAPLIAIESKAPIAVMGTDQGVQMYSTAQGAAPRIPGDSEMV